MKFEGNLKDLTKKSGIYKIICLFNKKIYIGSSCNLKLRFIEHRRKLRSGKHHSRYLQRSWSKYGPDNFLFEVVEFCENEQILNREQYWIDLLKSSDPVFGFNACPVAGSPRGIKRTPEQIEANRKRNIGKKLSPEILNAIREANKINQNKEFEICSPEGKVYKGIGIRTFALENNLNASALSAVLVGRTSNHRGWVKPENFGKKIKRISKKESKLMSPDGKTHIVEAGLLPQFCRENDLIWSNVHSVLSSKMRHHRGWTCADKPDYHVALIHEDGRTETICRYYLKPFVEEQNLSRSTISAVINNKRKQHKGWTLKKIL